MRRRHVTRLLQTLLLASTVTSPLWGQSTVGGQSTTGGQSTVGGQSPKRGQTPGGGSRLAGDLFSTISMSQTVSATESKANLSPTLSESTVSKQSLIIGEVSLANFLRKSDIASEIESQTVRVKLGDLIDVDGTDDEVQQSTLLFQVDAEDQRLEISLPLNESTTRSLIKGKNLLASLIELERFDHVHLAFRGNTLTLSSTLATPALNLNAINRAATLLAEGRRELRSIASSESSINESTVTDSSSDESAGDESIGNIALTGTPSSTQNATIASQPKSVAAPSAAASKSKQATTSAQHPTSAISDSAASAINLIGTWSAKISATQAWAIRFGDEGSFVLVHSQGSNNQVSRGSFRLDQNQLVLSGNGIVLKGAVTVTANAMTWELENASGQSTTKLVFDKKS